MTIEKKTGRELLSYYKVPERIENINQSYWKNQDEGRKWKESLEEKWVALSSLENATLQELTELSLLVRVMNEKSIRDEQTIFEERERVLGLKNRLENAIEKTKPMGYMVNYVQLKETVEEVVREMGGKKTEPKEEPLGKSTCQLCMGECREETLNHEGEKHIVWTHVDSKRDASHAAYPKLEWGKREAKKDWKEEKA